MCPISSIQDFFKYADYELREIRYFIVLLINPNYMTDAGKIIFNNLPYLNLRTRDVQFLIPGFSETNYNFQNQKHYISHTNPIFPASNIAFEKFNLDGFVQSIAWLEHTLPGYVYNEEANLCIIDNEALGYYVTPFGAARRAGSIEREDFVSFELDALHRDGHNVMKLFSEITTKIESGRTSLNELRYLTEQARISIYKGLPIFIAGSKTLVHQRNYVKSELLSLQNRLNYPLRIYTFEDFDDSFIEGGRQEQYNFFICNKAEYIIFILDGKVGGITLEEFKIAMSSFEKNGHPKIFVYSKLNDDLEEECEIANQLDSIRRTCMMSNQYFTEYRYDEQLPLLVYRSFSKTLL